MVDIPQNPEGGEESNSADGNFLSKMQNSFSLDKIKNFLTLGGDKQKWTKVIIISAAVVLILGLLSLMVWGAAISFWIRSIGEPNGGQIGGVGGNFRVIKTMDVYITMYSPHVESGGIDNDCDAGQGGGHGGEYASAADGSTFRLVNGKFQIKLPDKRIVEHIFAESQDDNIIPWKLRNSQAVQIPGVLDGIPIEVHDHYGSGVHRGEGNNNFLDLSYTCGPEQNEIIRQLKAAQKSQGLSGEKEGGILLKVNIVEASSSPVDVNNLRSWYFNQGSNESRGGGYWGTKRPSCGGWSAGNNFARVGCGVTSMAMLARYYGRNVDPYQYGEELCKVNHTSLLGGDNINGAASVFGKKAVAIDNPGNLGSITNNLRRGPLLAYGTHIFGSSNTHFVVIAGYDGSKLILNDPSRGSNRLVSTDSVRNISNLWYFVDK